MSGDFRVAHVLIVAEYYSLIIRDTPTSTPGHRRSKSLAHSTTDTVNTTANHHGHITVLTLPSYQPQMIDVPNSRRQQKQMAFTKKCEEKTSQISKIERIAVNYDTQCA